MDPVASKSGSDSVELPFHPGTLARALASRWLTILLIVCLAAAGGVAAGRFLGKRTYESGTLLHYRPLSSGRPSTPDATILSFLNQVKIPLNLDETRRRLELPVSLAGLGAAIDIKVAKNTTVLDLRATWTDPDTAAAIANTLADVFLANWFDSQIDEVGRMHKKALEEGQTLQVQADALAKTISEVEDRVKREITDQERDVKRIHPSDRANRLRAEIQEDRAARASGANLDAAQKELDRLKTLAAQEYVSQSQVERAQALVDREKVFAQDSDRIQQWKKQIEAAEGQAYTPQATASPSAFLLQATRLRAIDLANQQVAQAETRDRIEGGLQEARSALESYRKPDATPESRRQSRIALNGLLSRVLATRPEGGMEFEVVAEAVPPTLPVKSTRKLVGAAAGVGLLALGLLALLASELFRRTLRSPGDAKARLRFSVLGSLPVAKSTGPTNVALDEAIRTLARHVRREVPGWGVRIGVASASHGEGRTRIVRGLAACLAKRGERVLRVDLPAPGAVLSIDEPCGLSDLFMDESLPLSHAIHVDPADGLPVLGPGRMELEPDLLGTRRMGWILDEAVAAHDVILLDLPPMLPRSDAGLALSKCDGVVFVVLADSTPVDVARRALRVLEDDGGKVVGVVLNRASERYRNLGTLEDA